MPAVRSILIVLTPVPPVIESEVFRVFAPKLFKPALKVLFAAVAVKISVPEVKVHAVEGAPDANVYHPTLPGKEA